MNKNILVQDQGEKLFDAQAGDSDPTEDALTGLYSAGFFKTLLEKLSARNVTDTGFIVVRIENLNEITFERGYAFSSRLLSDTASEFLKVAGEKDLCARISKNEFVMVKINTTGKATWDTARNLVKTLKDLNPPVCFLSGSAIQNADMSVDAAYESARKGLA
jgi:GGDEF domain-containing protein